MTSLNKDLISVGISDNRARLLFSYVLTIAGGLSSQLYPLATALAINGVMKEDYRGIFWLAGCHFLTLSLEVAAKMADTRVFTRVYASLATHLTQQSFLRDVDPAILASRVALSREYVVFLERDVPALLSTIVSIIVCVAALFWLDPLIAFSSIALIIPLSFISRWLSKRSFQLNSRLNHRLEREAVLLKTRRVSSVRRHFKALSGWRIRLSDTEARAYFKMEVVVILLFSIALSRLGAGVLADAGSIYAVFSYIWKYVLALDGVPVLVQQLSKLKDLNRRLMAL